MNEQQQELQQMMEALDAMHDSMDDHQKFYARRAMASLLRLQGDLAEEDEQ
jgi:hypothetical protein